MGIDEREAFILHPREIIIRNGSTQVMFESELATDVLVARAVIVLKEGMGATKVVLKPGGDVSPVFKRFEPTDNGKPRTVYLAIWDHGQTLLRPLLDV